MIDVKEDKDVVDNQKSLGRVNTGSEVHAIRFLKSPTTPIHQYYFSENICHSL